MSTPISSINGSGSTSSSSSASATANNNQTLTQQDFLQLMVTQFEQQDPLSSGDDSNGGSSSYVNQLMAMTNLQTMQNMSQEQMDQLALTLPGSTVQINNDGTVGTGLVQSTSISNGSLYAIINGTQYPVSDLDQVTSTPALISADAAAQSLSASSSSSGSYGTTGTTGTSSTSGG